MRLSCRAAWKIYDSTLRLRLISTSSLVAMAEGSEEGKSKEKKQSVLSSSLPSRKTTAPKPSDEEKVDIASEDHSGDAPKVPKLQTHTSDTTSSRDKEPRPMPELKKHQTDRGEHGAGEPPREAYVMRVLKVQQRAEEYVSMPREEKRKLYKCGKKYSTLENISTLKEDIESGDIKQKSALKEGDDPELCSKVSLWRGDITRLESDAIVNAANSSLLGGGGVDGAIHAAAGLMLREECASLGGCSPGDAKITAGYKLPAKYVIHTVGPMMEKPEVLQSCYSRSFELVKEKMIRSVAFPCIATGIYGYPNEDAAHIALKTTKEWLQAHKDEVDRVIFCVFMDKDFRIYSELMPAYFPTAAPPLPPPKSRKEKGKVGEGAKKPASGGSSEEEEEMDQSGIPLRRDGSAAGDEESATGEKESLPGEEESSNQNMDQPTGWLFSFKQWILAVVSLILGWVWWRWNYRRAEEQ